MNQTELDRQMELIRKGNGCCIGCAAREISLAFMHHPEPMFEQAMLELLEHERIQVHYPAYCVLSMCNDKLSPTLAEALQNFRNSSSHTVRRALRIACREYGILIKRDADCLSG